MIMLVLFEELTYFDLTIAFAGKIDDVKPALDGR